jgi:hypothetical protein
VELDESHKGRERHLQIGRVPMMEMTMPNFLLAYHGGGVPANAEAEEAMMEAWNEWMATNAEVLLDIGTPVGTSLMIGPDGSASETAANQITGFAIIEADTMDGALAIARGCPILSEGGSIELSELADMDDFDDEDEDEEDDEEDEEK